MKIRKTLALLLVVMLLGLAACGGGSTPAVTGQSAEGTTEAPAAATTEPTEYTDPGVDYNGQTITYTAYSYDGTWAILKYNVGLTEETGEVLNDAIVRRNREVEEQLNVRFEMVPLNNNDRSAITVMEKYAMAQEDVLTFAMQMTVGVAKLLKAKGLMLDLKTIPTLDLDASWWNQNANEEYTINGHQYATLGDISLFNLGAPVVVYFSKDLVKDNKLESPYQLVYDGKWTIDKMHAMAEVAARDVNGDGAPDEKDIFGLAAEPGSLDYGLYSAGVRISERDSSGKIVLSFYNERSVSYCEKFVPFVRDRNVSMIVDEWGGKYSNTHADFIMPKLMRNELLFYSNQLHVTLSLRAMESDFGIVPMPKLDEAQEKYLSVANRSFADHVVVPVTNARAEQTGNVLDAMGYYAQQCITPAFIEQSIVLKGIRDEDSQVMIRMALDNEVFDVGFLFNWGNVLGTLHTMVTSGDTNLASGWAAVEPAVTAALEDAMESMKD